MNRISVRSLSSSYYQRIMEMATIETIDFSKILHQACNNASLIYYTSPTLTFTCVFSLIFFIYYYKKIVKRPRFICKNEKFKQFILKNCGQLIEKPIYPTWWAFGSFPQTILSNVIRGTLPKHTYRRQIIAIPDGGEVALDWYKDDEKSKDTPICILMPGLTGDSNTEYITSLVPAVESSGVRCCVMINRGRGGLNLRTPRLYCASNCEDAEFVLNHLKSNYPNSKLIAIGISLGGIVLGRYLTQKGEDAVIDAGMLLSVCYDFFSGCASLETNRLNLVLNKHLSRSLKAILVEQRPILEQNQKLDYENISQCLTLKELDREFTCKMWNYPEVEDYYRDASLKDRLHLIKKPMLCLNAEDDMFQPIKSFPLQEFEDSPNLALVLTSRGGHIGFMDVQLPFFSQVPVCGQVPFFIERLVSEYLKALLAVDNIKETIG